MASSRQREGDGDERLGEEPEEPESNAAAGEAVANAAYEQLYESNERTWERLTEDEHGHLAGIGIGAPGRARHQQRLRDRAQRQNAEGSSSAPARKGLIRSLVLAVDLSRSSLITDMRPTRASVALRAASRFVDDFFDQNPLSKLAVHCLSSGVSHALTPLSASPAQHTSALSEGLEPGGELSVQNCLESALEALAVAPPYGTKEVLVLQSGLSTCDPGDIFTSVKKCTSRGVRVSFVGIGAEVYACRRVADDTNGSYAVCTDETHFATLIRSHAPPPVEAPSSASALVKMGFPSTVSESATPGSSAAERELVIGMEGGLYVCPRCKARVREVPSTCAVCSLALVASPHLARSFHHLFPVPQYNEVSGIGEQELCQCCLSPAADEDGFAFQCSRCQCIACASCDAFVHKGLHNCPGCELPMAMSKNWFQRTRINEANESLGGDGDRMQWQQQQQHGSATMSNGEVHMEEEEGAPGYEQA